MIPPSSVSAVVIALNESRRIARCLRRLSWCDEIVLVDAFSRDDTPEIARSFGARVLQRAWDGFAGQKNYGIDQASGDWILVVEADESVTEGLEREILSTLPRATQDGFRVPRLNVFLGAPVRHSDLYPDYQLRLFRRGRGRYGLSNPPHETVVVQGQIGRLRHPMIHRSYDSIEEFVRRLDGYTTAAARDLIARGKRPGILDLLSRPVGRWIKVYGFKRGFLDGHRGILLAGLYAGYVFAKYAKIWAMGKGIGVLGADALDSGV